MAFVYAPAGADNTATYDVESSSLIKYRDGIVDNIFRNNVILNKLKANGAIVIQDGGTSIALAVEYAENGTVEAMDYYSALDTTPQKISQTAEYQWGMYAGTTSISHKEKRQNAGANIYNVAEAKAKNLSKAMSGKINADLFAASATANGVGTLVTYIDATSAIGNINSTSQSFWQATNTTSGSFGAQGLSDMETTWSAVSDSNMSDSPSFIITTSAVFGYYNLALQPQIRYMSTGSADGSFQNLKYKTADVVWDNDCTTGAMYFINTEALKLYIDSGTNFIMFDAVRPSNQIAETAQMAVMLQLVATNRRRLGKILSITA